MSKTVGHNVRAEHSVDGHVSILLGKWPVADRYIELWPGVDILRELPPPQTFLLRKGAKVLLTT